MKPFIHKKPSVVSLIGGGGKTTTMYYLISTNKDAVATTTTKIFPPRWGEADFLWLLKGDNLDGLKDLVSKGKLVLGRDIKGGKVVGVEPDLVDRLKLLGFSVAVEADGSKGFSIKVHREDEPVIPLSTDMVVIIFGADVLGKAVSKDTVFRYELIGKIGLKGGERIEGDIFLRFLDGYLSKIPDGMDYSIFINKADIAEEGILKDTLDLLLDRGEKTFYGSAKKGVIRKYDGNLEIYSG